MLTSLETSAVAGIKVINSTKLVNETKLSEFITRSEVCSEGCKLACKQVKLWVLKYLIQRLITMLK